jgi:hypothetical protein
MYINGKTEINIWNGGGNIHEISLPNPLIITSHCSTPEICNIRNILSNFV